MTILYALFGILLYIVGGVISLALTLLFLAVVGPILGLIAHGVLGGCRWLYDALLRKKLP